MTAGFVLLILILITIGVLQDSSQNKRTYKIIMVPKTIDESNDFWTGLIEGAKLGAEEFGCEIDPALRASLGRRQLNRLENREIQHCYHYGHGIVRNVQCRM